MLRTVPRRKFKPPLPWPHSSVGQSSLHLAAVTLLISLPGTWSILSSSLDSRSHTRCCWHTQGALLPSIRPVRAFPGLIPQGCRDVLGRCLFLCGCIWGQPSCVLSGIVINSGLWNCTESRCVEGHKEETKTSKLRDVWSWTCKFKQSRGYEMGSLWGKNKCFGYYSVTTFIKYISLGGSLHRG